MIGPKSAHLVERAAARLLESGALEGSAAQLLNPDRAQAPPFADPDRTEPAAASLVPAIDLPATDQPAREVQEAGERADRAPRPVIETTALRRAGMFDWSRGRSRISEEFRLAQRQLLRAAFAPAAEAGL